jgi:hypothetical protein
MREKTVEGADNSHAFKKVSPKRKQSFSSLRHFRKSGTKTAISENLNDEAAASQDQEKESSLPSLINQRTLWIIMMIFGS